MLAKVVPLLLRKRGIQAIEVFADGVIAVLLGRQYSCAISSLLRGDDLMLLLKINPEGFEEVPVDWLPVGLNPIREQVVPKSVDLPQQLGQFTGLGLLPIKRRIKPLAQFIKSMLKLVEMVIHGLGKQFVYQWAHQAHIA